MKALTCGLVLGVLAASTCVSADIIQVPDGYATLAAALSVAAAGDTIYVARGTYYETGLEMPAGVLLSAAPGDEREAIVDGGEEVASILKCEDASAGSVVRGITFQNAWQSAIFARNSSIDIELCAFNQNRGRGHGGGAIFASDSELSIDTCSFMDNDAGWWTESAEMGGAIRALRSQLTIENCAFDRNHSGDFYGGGGAIYASASSISCLGSTFRRNRSTGQGGSVLHLDSAASALVADCVLSGNDAPSRGGAVLATEGSQARIENTERVNNFETPLP